MHKERQRLYIPARISAIISLLVHFDTLFACMKLKGLISLIHQTLIAKYKQTV